MAMIGFSMLISATLGGSSDGVTGAPKGIRKWLWGAYPFATDRNDFWKNLIVNLRFFTAGVWLSRNLGEVDVMASQPGL
uniref:Uncharacterized protein n=1 Tax=Vombatus ursinus TaxID=29139 RepID=A0A4X2KWF1_VOMUR